MRNRMQPAPALMPTLKIGVAIVLALLALSGCSADNATPGRGAAAKTADRAVLYSMDRSGSADGFRRPFCGAMYSLVASGLGGGRLIVHRFDNKVGKAYEGYPDSLQDLQAKPLDTLAPPATAQGTRPDLMLAHLITTVLPRCPEEKIGLVLSWDGGNDGKPLTPYINALKAERRVRAVWLIIPKPDQRAAAERLFKPLGQRLISSGASDVPDGLQQFYKLLG